MAPANGEAARGVARVERKFFRREPDLRFDEAGSKRTRCEPGSTSAPASFSIARAPGCRKSIPISFNTVSAA